jgi:outer membrane cobalamin receptor
MRYCFLLLIFFFSLIVRAQENIQFTEAPLTEVLKTLEDKYDVKFSFNPNFVQNKYVNLSLDNTPLAEVLVKIESDLGVSFEKVDERYYILKNKMYLTFCGYLKDATDYSSIEGGTISNAAQTIGVVSDTSGYFELKKISPSDTLYISYLGFRTLEIPSNQLAKTCDTFLMSPDSYVLNEVIVKEYLAAGILKTRDGSIKVKPGNLDILAGQSEPDILQNIQLLPGIESPSETASGLYIRGGSPDQNLILWDGIKMYNSDHFFGMISAFNPYIAASATVSRSGTKSEYGDRVSGVIDIKTDDDIPKKTEGGLGLNMTHFDAFLKVPLSDEVGVLVSGRRSITDVFQTPAFNQFSKKVFQNSSITENQMNFEPEFSENNEQFYFADISLKLIAALSDKDQLIISSLYTKNQLDYSFKDDDFDLNTSDKLGIENQGINMSWQRNWNPKFSSKTQFYYSAYDFQYEGKDNYFENSLPITKTNNIKELGASLHTVWHLNNQFTFSNGYQFFSNRVAYLLQEGDLSDSDDFESPTHAVYTQLNYSKPQSWYVDAGLRASYYVGFEAVFFEPRLYIERLFGDHFRIKASAEIKNQAVSQIIEFTTQDFGLENQVWALSGSEGFPILKSDQLSAGFLFTKNGWNLDLDAYYKNINGLTSFTRGFESANDNFSEGSSTTKGIDILLKKKINNYSTWVGYTYSLTDFIFDDLNNGNAFRGNNDINHSLTWSHAYQWNDFQFSLGWKFRSGIPFTKALGTQLDADGFTVISYGTINAETLPAYHRMDISALYDFKISKKENTPQAKIGFSLLNLYGRDNLLSKSFGLFSSVDENDNPTIELGQIDKFSLGLTPNVVFRLNF